MALQTRHVLNNNQAVPFVPAQHPQQGRLLILLWPFFEAYNSMQVISGSGFQPVQPPAFERRQHPIYVVVVAGAAIEQAFDAVTYRWWLYVRSFDWRQQVLLEAGDAADPASGNGASAASREPCVPGPGARAAVDQSVAAVAALASTDSSRTTPTNKLEGHAARYQRTYSATSSRRW